jgi:hypothetical protein
MPDQVFYDSAGRAIAYTEDGQHIYSYNGIPVAYIEGDSIFAYSGEHLGWFLEGWVRDHTGACVCFTEGAKGGPVRPVRQLGPVKGVEGVRPVRGVREVGPVRPVRLADWSSITLFKE